MYLLIMALIIIFGGGGIIFLYYGILEILDSIRMGKRIKEVDDFYNK